MYYPTVLLALVLPFFAVASPLPWDGAPSYVTRHLLLLARLGRYLRVYSDRYTGSSNNVAGGGVTGGGGIELLKLFSHNGMLRVASRPIRGLIAAFFLQPVALVLRRAATHKGDRVEIDSCRYFFFVRFIWLTLRILFSIVAGTGSQLDLDPGAVGNHQTRRRQLAVRPEGLGTLVRAVSRLHGHIPSCSALAR